ncbi:MAG: acyl-CoA dehydrogenase [Alphaproteobacteria bacterium]|jgi:alkylation response protein AidB-like acyl-CoA dehydrogenase|nr:acyl-CoA dehydrogenase [Alphaproteobacteria bacterium]
MSMDDGATVDFGYTTEQVQIRDAARGFTERVLTRAFLQEIDVNGRAPNELLPEMAKLGFTGLPVPAEYGGSGGNATDVTVLLEEFGRSSLSVASLLNRALGWGADAIQRFGTEAQKDYFLPRVASGEMIFAFSHTEPNAGSDAAAIITKAAPDGEDFIISGSKIFTTGAAECPCLIVTARTDATLGKHKGISVFLVDATTPGINSRRIEKLGMRGAGTLCEVHYDDVRVPTSALLGELHGGWRVIGGTLERARIAQASYCVGAAQRVIDDAVQYANEREQFGQPIGRFQAIAHLLVDLQVRTDAARLLLYRAASMIDEGVPCVREASIANLHATETLVRVTSEGMRVWGGYGFTREFEIERILRDARLFVIGDGSSQIQRNLIARQMGL